MIALRSVEFYQKANRSHDTRWLDQKRIQGTDSGRLDRQGFAENRNTEGLRRGQWLRICVHTIEPNEPYWCALMASGLRYRPKLEEPMRNLIKFKNHTNPSLGYLRSGAWMLRGPASMNNSFKASAIWTAWVRYRSKRDRNSIAASNCPVRASNWK